MKSFIALAVLFFSIHSFAHEHGHGEGPCAKDREKYCADVEPGEGRMMKCMKDNKDKLSPECKEHREKMKKHMKEMRKHHSEDTKE
jgi:hypothetical protein